MGKRGDSLQAMKRHLLALGFLLVLTLACYGSMLNDGWYHSDDLRFFSWAQSASWSDLFHRSHSGYIRPILNALWLLPLSLGLRDPVWYHLLSLVLFYGVVCAVYSLIWRMTGRFLPALIGTFLFCLHPAHRSATTWIATSLADLPSTLLLVICFLGFLAESHIVGLIFFALALSAKQSVVVLPILMLAWIVLEGQTSRWKKLLPYFALALVYAVIQTFWLRESAYAAVRLINWKPVTDPVGLFQAWVSGWGGLVFPLAVPRHTLAPPFPLVPREALFPIGLAVLPLVAYLALRYPKTRFGLFWIALTFLPAIPLGRGYVLGRHYLVPDIGLALVVSSLIAGRKLAAGGNNAAPTDPHDTIGRD